MGDIARSSYIRRPQESRVLLVHRVRCTHRWAVKTKSSHNPFPGPSVRNLGTGICSHAGRKSHVDTAGKTNSKPPAPSTRRHERCAIPEYRVHGCCAQKHLQAGLAAIQSWHVSVEHVTGSGMRIQASIMLCNSRSGNVYVTLHSVSRSFRRSGDLQAKLFMHNLSMYPGMGSGRMSLSSQSPHAQKRPADFHAISAMRCHWWSNVGSRRCWVPSHVGYRTAGKALCCWNVWCHLHGSACSHQGYLSCWKCMYTTH